MFRFIRSSILVNSSIKFFCVKHQQFEHLLVKFAVIWLSIKLKLLLMSKISFAKKVTVLQGNSFCDSF